MTRKELPPVDLLRKLLRYEPDTGKLFWLSRDFGNVAWNSRNSGKEAGELHSRGYVHISILGAKYKAHRIIWCMITGSPPLGDIDHINGVRSDNRIANLRDIPPEENKKNTKLQSNNKSGVTGVHYDVRRQKWLAYIKVANKRKHIGRFDSFDQAVAERMRCQSEMGFHENHGRPA